MKMTDNFYSGLNTAIRKNKALTALVPSLCRALTAYVFLMYFALMIFLFLGGKYIDLLLTIVLCALGFALVTVLRKLIARKRPYVSQNYEPVIKREKDVGSMPSRHAYSVFVIALASFQISPYLFAVNIVCGIILALLRVLGGVHYISDVLVSIFIAAVFGFYFLI